jgi:hypothetical protein
MEILIEGVFSHENQSGILENAKRPGQAVYPKGALRTIKIQKKCIN